MIFISDVFKGNKEDLDYLIELGKELKTQDNLGTRKPLIFKIMENKTVHCTSSFYDFKSIGFSQSYEELVEFSDEEFEKAVEYIKENYSYDEELDDVKGFDDLTEFCDDYDIDHEIIYHKKEIYYTGEFLTRKAAEDHLKKFHYRYTDEARIYCDCAVENDEITKLTEILERLYEMNNREEIR